MKKSETTDPIQKELVSYSEDKLQRSVIEPLLRAMGFKDVRDRSGTNEKGKDLTAVKEEVFGTSYYAIQLKKTKLSGRVASTNSLSFVLGQLRQAIVEKIVFPTEMEPIKPDRLVFITPYPMENSAASSLESSLADIKSKGVTIIDGIQLSDLVRKHLPEFLTGEEIYRRNTFKSSGSLIEANVALQTHKFLTMQDIYVDVSVADKRNVLNSLANKSLSLKNDEVIGAITKKEFEYYLAHKTPLFLLESIAQKSKSFSLGLPNVGSKIVSLDIPAVGSKAVSLNMLRSHYKEGLNKKLVWPKSKGEVDNYNHFMFTSPKRLFEETAKAAKYCLEVFDSHNKTKYSKEEIEEGFNKIHDINTFVLSVLKSSFIKTIWSKSISPSDGHTIRLSPETLIFSTKPICIVGAAGAGKTTLLKHITQLATQNDSYHIPIFIPLLHLTNYSKQGVIEFIFDELLKGGYIVEGKSKNYHSNIPKMLSSGKFRLHFDGLDEAGHNVKKAINAIKKIYNLYPKSPIIITSRHTISIDWTGLIKFTIEPFSSDKLIAFVNKWFDAEPSSKKDLTNWINSHQRLQSVAQTPLIAALLCVLYSADVELPETEEELYSRRLELLLGQWDRAKGVKSMPKKRREAYRLYLMSLAFEMHSSDIREISYTDAVSKSEPYYKEFRDSPHAIVVDCLSRGLLFKDELGNISFGHLTYQEHLAALFLTKHNPVLEILEKLKEPWWNKTLQFYAMQMTSINQLIKQANKYSRFSAEKNKKLQELIPFAPYTDIELKDRN